jgi:predicted adenine nucleotide alpha hydrolase (AANH) superfamily ATPase
MSTPIKINQAWNKELGIADRCTTCHLAVDNTLFKNAPEPFRYHAAARDHDFGKIGCTICHMGQGRATETHDAHGRNVVHWDSPMRELNMVEMSCPQCHSAVYRPGYRLKGANYLNMANNLSVNAEHGPRCVGCHPILVGHGVRVPSERWTGVIAPDISIYGESNEHEFEQTHDMRFIEGKHSKYSWTKEHFLDPVKVMPGDEETGRLPTIMPNFKLSDEEAHALSIFVMTMKLSDIPAKFWYKETAEKAEN